MPEGDTIHTIAGLLGPALEGARVERFEMRAHGPVGSVRGAIVGTVTARGKHLLVELGRDWTLRVHVGMDGSWHHYRPGEPWRRSARSAGVILATADHVFVCYAPQDAELVPRAQVERHPELARLGPDILDPDFRVTAVLARPRRAADAYPEGAGLPQFLLDQSLVAGIGNVYKSEGLFLERIDPDTAPRELDDDRLAALYRRVRDLMRENVHALPRVTTGARGRSDPRAPRAWVHGRAGRPCLRCGTAVRRREDGRPPRVTFWCPRCPRGAADNGPIGREH